MVVEGWEAWRLLALECFGLNSAGLGGKWGTGTEGMLGFEVDGLLGVALAAEEVGAPNAFEDMVKFSHNGEGKHFSGTKERPVVAWCPQGQVRL